MTEEDTFRKLKQTPYRELNWMAGTFSSINFYEYLKVNGWEIREFAIEHYDSSSVTARTAYKRDDYIRDMIAYYTPPSYND